MKAPVAEALNDEGGQEAGQGRQALLTAILPHVPFDGWSDKAFRAAARDAGRDAVHARVLCPGGARDLARDWHVRGDRALAGRLAVLGPAGRYRDRVSQAVRLRLEGLDREVLRRSVALFALPQNAPIAAALVWGTADAIWEVLGDNSRDVNWYTKRMILGGVWSALVLFHLGDTSEGSEASWAFLDRRIEDVMRFERLKARVRENAPLMKVLAGPLSLLSHIRAPGADRG